MIVSIDRSATAWPQPEEGDLFLDEDGDLNLVVAAVHLEGVRPDDLVVCCLKGDAAWIRGRADRDTLAGMNRLAPGDRITLTAE